jgi:hypothetical protein
MRAALSGTARGPRLLTPGLDGVPVSRYTSIMSNISGNIITALATIGAVAVTLLATGYREQKYRNHAARAEVAREYFSSYNAYRRALRLKRDDPNREDHITTSGQRLSDISTLMGVYFDETTVTSVDKAVQGLNEFYAVPDPQPTGDPSIDLLKAVKVDVKRQIEPRGRDIAQFVGRQTKQRNR